MSTTNISVLTFEGVNLFQLSIPGMVFGSITNDRGQNQYQISHCAQNPGNVITDQGVTIRVDKTLEALVNADIVIVPAWNEPNSVGPQAILIALQKAHANGALIVGLCLGAFLLGDAGLLNDRQATTHWIERDLFSDRFPHALFRPDMLYVTDGNIITSAGSVAAIDCCLHIVRQRHGSDVANQVARFLVTPPHRQGGQAQYIQRPIPQFGYENRLLNILEWAGENIAEPITVEMLAAKANMTRRTFTRRFKETTGTTVIKWINSERIRRAQELLETTDMSMECIASHVGFGTTLTLRQQFNAQLGTSPSDYRRLFCTELKRSKDKNS